VIVAAVMKVLRPFGRALASLSVCGALLQLMVPFVGAQAGSSSPQSKPPATRDLDGGWPRDLTTTTGAIRIYQPQIASWDGQRHLVAYAAVSYTAKGADKPSLGTVKIEADTSVAVGERLVNFSPITLTESNFPGVSNDEVRAIVARIQQAIPDNSMVIGLDRVLAGLDKSRIIPRNNAGVKADPPVIFYSASPAVLVNLDGTPVWSPIKDSDLRFAVNTNWDLFEYKPTTTAGSRRPRPISRDPGGPQASSLTPSRSCRPTTTGKTSKPRCLGRRSRKHPCPRCSSVQPPRR